jgi:hypothetical protein
MKTAVQASALWVPAGLQGTALQKSPERCNICAASYYVIIALHGQTITTNELVCKMKLVVHMPSKIAGWIVKVFPPLVGLGYISACIWFAVWLTGSKWLGVPLGLILCKGLLVLYMNAYDKLIIPIIRRRERLRRGSPENCGRYGVPNYQGDPPDREH